MVREPRRLDQELPRLLCRPPGGAGPAISEADFRGDRGACGAVRRARHPHLRNRGERHRHARPRFAARAEGREIDDHRRAARRFAPGHASTDRGARPGHAHSRPAGPFGPVGLSSGRRRGDAGLGRLGLGDRRGRVGPHLWNAARTRLRRRHRQQRGAHLLPPQRSRASRHRRLVSHGRRHGILDARQAGAGIPR